MFAPKLVYKLRKDISTVFYDGRIIPRHTEYEHFYEDTVDGEIYPSVTARTGIIEKKHLKQWAANQAVDSLLDFISNNPTPDPLDLAAASRKARDAHNQALNQASTWGTDAHDMVDNYVRLWIAGEQPVDMAKLAGPTISGESISAALAAEQFFKDYTLFPIVSEKKLVSKKGKYGGTLDTLFLIAQKEPNEPECMHSWKDGKTKSIKCEHCGTVRKLTLLLLDLKTSNQVIGNYSYANQVGAYSQALSEMVKIKPELHWILQVSKNRPKYDIAVVRDIKKETEGFNLMNKLAQYIEAIEDPLVPLKQKNIIKL